MTKALSTTKAQPTALAIPAEVSKDFDHARRFYGAAKGGMLQAAGCMVLLGFELARLKKSHGITRGGDRKSDQTRSDRVCSWGDLVKAELGFTDDTAAKYIAMAQAAKARVKILQELEGKLLTIPFHLLPDAERTKAEGAVKKITDGATARSFMEECGIARTEKGSNLKKDRNPGGNPTSSKTTPEEEAQSVFKHLLRSIGDVMDPWHVFELRLYTLPLAVTEAEAEEGKIALTDVEDALQSLLDHTRKARERIAKAMHGSRTKDATARLKEAQASALKQAQGTAAAAPA